MILVEYSVVSFLLYIVKPMVSNLYVIYVFTYMFCLYVLWKSICCDDSRVSSDSGQRAEQEQEVGIVVPLQEEVGLGGGAGSDWGGEDGDASARPPRIQAQEVFPLRNQQRIIPPCLHIHFVLLSFPQTRLNIYDQCICLF